MHVGTQPIGVAPGRQLDREPVRWQASMEPLYPLPARPPLHKVCIPVLHPPFYQQKTVYEFDAEEIGPESLGPRIRERPRNGLPRTLLQSRAALEWRRELLRQCYRWARYRDRSLQGVVRVEVRIDPFGAWTTPRAVPELAAGAELAACVGMVLPGLREAAATPRNTDGEFRILFIPSGQDRPHSPPPRPTADRYSDSASPACLLLEDQVPVDRLASQEPLLEINDYDEQQAREQQAREDKERWERERERERERIEARAAGRLARRPVSPPDETLGRCSLGTRPSSNSSDIRQSLRYNLGAYQACYAQALLRHPGLAGRVVLSAMVDGAGNLTVLVKQSTVGDPQVQECLRQAMEDVWFEPWSQGLGQIQLTYPLILIPGSKGKPLAQPPIDTIAGIEAHAAAQLQRGDGAAAMRGYATLLQNVPDHPRACQWHIGALEAALARAPWQDERVFTAEAGLVGVLSGRTGNSAGALRSACLDRAVPLLTRLAAESYELGALHRVNSLLERAVQRYQLVLGLRPDLPDANQLRYSLARTLWAQERYCAAAPIFVQVTKSNPNVPHRRIAANYAVWSWESCLYLNPKGPMGTFAGPATGAPLLRSTVAGLLEAYELDMDPAFPAQTHYLELRRDRVLRQLTE